MKYSNPPENWLVIFRGKFFRRISGTGFLWSLTFIVGASINKYGYYIHGDPVYVHSTKQTSIIQNLDNPNVYQVIISLVLILFYGPHNGARYIEGFVNNMLVAFDSECGYKIPPLFGTFWYFSSSCWDVF